MRRLSIPTESFLLEGSERPRNTWIRFFQDIIDLLRTKDTVEIGTGKEGANGNWQFIQSGSNLVLQKRESGSWVTKDTWTP